MQFFTITAVLFATVASAAPAPGHASSAGLDTNTLERVTQYTKSCKVTDTQSLQACINNCPVHLGSTQLPAMATSLSKRNYLPADQCWARASDGQRALMVMFPLSALEICKA